MLCQPLGKSHVDNNPKKTLFKDDKKEEVVEELKPEVDEFVAEAESEVYNWRRSRV